jgi:hypothetical protein
METKLFFRVTKTVLIATLILSVFGPLGASSHRPDLSFLFSGVSSSEDSYGEFVEGHTQFSVLCPIYRKWFFTLESGVSYLNTHKDIRGYEYNLTHLIVPLRLTASYPLTRSLTVYGGGQGGLSILLETFDHNETYTSVGVGGILGADYALTKRCRFIFEVSNFSVNYPRVDNLDTTLYLTTLGLGYTF